MVLSRLGNKKKNWKQPLKYLFIPVNILQVIFNHIIYKSTCRVKIFCNNNIPLIYFNMHGFSYFVLCEIKLEMNLVQECYCIMIYRYSYTLNPKEAFVVFGISLLPLSSLPQSPMCIDVDYRIFTGVRLRVDWVATEANISAPGDVRDNELL
jgi:hypothetical protein